MVCTAGFQRRHPEIVPGGHAKYPAVSHLSHTIYSVALLRSMFAPLTATKKLNSSTIVSPVSRCESTVKCWRTLVHSDPCSQNGSVHRPCHRGLRLRPCAAEAVFLP